MEAAYHTSQAAFKRKGISRLHYAVSGFRVVMSNRINIFLAIQAVLRLQVAAAHIVFNVGTVIAAVAFAEHGQSQPRCQRQSVPFHARHHIYLVPRTRSGMVLTVGRIQESHTYHAQLAAGGQIGLHRLDDENFRSVVGIAERCKFMALIVNLLIGFLSISEP